MGQTEIQLDRPQEKHPRWKTVAIRYLWGFPKVTFPSSPFADNPVTLHQLVLTPVCAAGQAGLRGRGRQRRAVRGRPRNGCTAPF